MKYVTLFLMIFDPPSPCQEKLSQILDPLKVCHTSEQKVKGKYQENADCLNLNNFDHYCILNNNKNANARTSHCMQKGGLGLEYKIKRN